MDNEYKEELKDKINTFFENKDIPETYREIISKEMFIEYYNYNKDMQEATNDDDFEDMEEADELDDFGEELEEEQEPEEYKPTKPTKKEYEQHMEKEYPNYAEQPKPKPQNHKKGIVELIKKPRLKRTKPKRPSILG